ncbi:hypothetical protein FH609_004185 [Streptomyces sp. 3MP-14]|uniref:Uncharacterized protein n=1 Tax=Streptomyces mimosae TaxID=2586635 RepID=A0A5N6A3V9_9ACTN|nr:MULTISPECIES: hypothetical protein [Streptomyces]KAB8162932.1 hypothetical protein FH607_020045 [Streptomyces mimosae]KAB8179146.1 hypothetical protein FH609_004185 [Streptomyces sp. 3MP-14]
MTDDRFTSTMSAPTDQMPLHIARQHIGETHPFLFYFRDSDVTAQFGHITILNATSDGTLTTLTVAHH